MIRQGRTRDTALVKNREMTGIGAKLSAWWRGEGGVKTTENKIQYISPVALLLLSLRPGVTPFFLYVNLRFENLPLLNS
jgi:hypothetical protein